MTFLVKLNQQVKYLWGKISHMLRLCRASKGKTSMKIPWRKNVLSLMIIAYAAVMFVFFGLIDEGTDAKDSYDVIKEPLMALVGGTLALAKDLVPFGLDEEPSRTNEKIAKKDPPGEEDGN